MGLFDFFRGEFIEVIEWLDESRDLIVWRFDHHDNEIKNGAKLVVRESQAAVLVSEGQMADVYPPGTHTLATQNMPVLSKLKGWAYGFESPFKSEVYFVNTRVFADRKWGTKNPITLRDPEIGPVRIRAFGNYALRVSDPAKFLRQLVGTSSFFSTEDINNNLRDMIVPRFADIIGEAKVPVLDLAANYNEFGNYIKEKISHDFDEYGVEITKVLVENISLPPDVEAMLDKRSSMGIVGNLDQFTKYQVASNLEGLGQSGGIPGVGLGVGMAVGNQVANALNNTAPPPVPPAVTYFVAVNGQQTGPYDVAILTNMANQGLLSRDSLVWAQGMAGWTAAGQVSALGSVFATVPPPLPPA
ncbi:MAG: SPFH domain-containing protein [Bernardetiaceae bacterium]|jgi:membrane protease subunit (stomatin/prohibitin family)|nr:SPFH domain-containing protein [Bernardetiaceae bacterium]